VRRPSCPRPDAVAVYVHVSEASNPMTRFPLEELALSLEYMKLIESLLAVELEEPSSASDDGTPRGKETTTGSYSGLYLVTCTLILVGLSFLFIWEGLLFSLLSAVWVVGDR